MSSINSSIVVPIATPNEPISKYEQQRNKNVQENKSYLRRLFDPQNASVDEPKKSRDKQPQVPSELI